MDESRKKKIANKQNMLRTWYVCCANLSASFSLGGFWNKQNITKEIYLLISYESMSMFWYRELTEW